MTGATTDRPGGRRGRKRLDTEQRREQLLRIGAELFAERPYDDVWIERVAELADVSRGLLYHYFPTKRDFFAEVVRAEGRRLLGMTRTDPALPLRDRLTYALDVYLTYAEEHAQGYRAFHRAAASADDEIKQIFQEIFTEQERRIVAALEARAEAGGTRPSSEGLRIAVRGWLSFATTVCLEWLEHRTLTRDQVRELCTHTLLGAVSAVPARPEG
ncbi:TetR/AcrR family transcriptional regulator [Streptomyces sp. B1866]|uniref:TetR/AcrR family transcriptional regulator n=1 Tax=Streptomyces sp. B1866 TaxID=3075431 RepID=UPI0028910692|nr:TetR/AcrR family transcriptional regulator [Streptomyces sp. B1866]MDT3398365.1 TetR/AcrR family transcriptional regulator [Streptomyces sp. B1866]